VEVWLNLKSSLARQTYTSRVKRVRGVIGSGPEVKHSSHTWLALAGVTKRAFLWRSRDVRDTERRFAHELSNTARAGYGGHPMTAPFASVRENTRGAFLPQACSTAVQQHHEWQVANPPRRVWVRGALPLATLSY
jgi:hypothetical protein